MINVAPNKRYNNVLTIINDLSKINKKLDWVYSKYKSSYIWKFNTDASITTVYLNRDQNNFITYAKKYIINSENVQKQHAFTGTHSSEKEAFKFLKEKL